MDRMQGLQSAMDRWTAPGMARQWQATQPAKKRSGSTPEARVLHAILAYLKARKIFHWRQNVGAIKTDHGFMRFGSAGQPDVMAIIGGKFYAIEAKSAAGRQSDDQKAWQARCEAAGGVYILARSVDDIINANI